MATLVPPPQVSKPGEANMAQFTQLDLQGKTAALVGSLMVTSLLAVFFLGTSGCSKKEPAKSVAMSQNQPMPPASITPNSPKAPTESLPAAPKKPAKKSAKRRSSTVTYTNRT